MVPLIPVIDIRHGIAVHAVAGKRSSYKPLRSSIVSGVEPAGIVSQLAEQMPSLATCYVADLDAIEGRGINRCTLAEMIRVGVPLLVDAGCHTPEQIDALLDLGVQSVVVPSESCSDLNALDLLVERFDPNQICASIDLKSGTLLTKDPKWSGRSGFEVAERVVSAGFTRVIVLDLSAVGMNHGMPTVELCKTIHDRFPDLALITGGGVHSWNCLIEAESAGVSGVLVGSALHDGRLSLNNLR